MGLDATLIKVNKKYASFKERILDFDKFILESNHNILQKTVYYTNEINVHYLFKKIQENNNLKVDFNENEEMLITKKDLICIINYIEDNIQSSEGLERLNEDGVIINNEPGHFYYNKDWWTSEVIVPLRNIIDDYSENKETIFYSAWF